jgi:methyl-accepting chemotaxis protein
MPPEENKADSASASGGAGQGRVFLDVLPVWSGQIDMARAHIEDAAVNLVNYFMGISSRIDQIAVALESAENSVAEVRKETTDKPSVADNLGKLQESLHALRGERDAISEAVHRGIVALQFQDRVSQVLMNVRTNLEKLRDRVDNSGHLPETFDVGSWLDELLKSYSMIQQRDVHMGDAPQAHLTEGDIELF